MTITGQLPSVTTVTAVYFGQYEGIIDTRRLAFVSLLFYSVQLLCLSVRPSAKL